MALESSMFETDSVNKALLVKCVYQSVHKLCHGEKGESKQPDNK